MKRVVGIDIGNSTTESALAEIHESGEVRFSRIGDCQYDRDQRN